MGNSFWRKLRFIPLVLVLLSANSETRQLVSETLQHLFGCTTESCNLEATTPGTALSVVSLLVQGVALLLANTAQRVPSLGLLMFLAFGVLFLPKTTAVSHQSRAPPVKVRA